MVSRSSAVPEEVEAAEAMAEKRVNAMAVYFIVLEMSKTVWSREDGSTMGCLGYFRKIMGPTTTTDILCFCMPLILSTIAFA